MLGVTCDVTVPVSMPLTNVVNRYIFTYIQRCDTSENASRDSFKV